MTAAIVYLDFDEAKAIVAAHLPSGDRRRVVFAALSAGDGAAHLVGATRDIDAVGYAGARANGTTQATAWPRIDGNGRAIDPDPDEPTVTPPPVTGAPRGVRAACAIQAADRAAAAVGVGAALHVAGAVHRGVAAQSGRGRSETYDAVYARRAIAALCPEAKALVQRYVRRSSPVT